MENKNEGAPETTDQVVADNETESQTTVPAAKKKRKRWPIVVGVIAVVAVVAGIGGMIWHDQPSFCNAICHDPMDTYVESYYSGDSTCLVTAHADSGLTCLQCHEAKIDEQVGEATAWVSGGYTTDENGYIVDDSVHIATTDFCLQCHNKDDIVAATADYNGNVGYNPHESHNGTLECGDCHSMHGTSTLYCNSCHDLGTPDGWGDVLDERDVGFSFQDSAISSQG